ncbi:protein ABHD14B isoform X5 [Telopea speciosissima]|uniref:protein ABHD14B isoform X5 n=1 Tax=Telopea speciosissima TaxID=54955 RepID=UPI001CC6808F|nr:protein ABHD14B isoform X5 [Telopea speciosissima]
MLALGVGLTPPIQFSRKCRSSRGGFGVWADGFPSFLPKEVEEIKDPFARKLAKRIERLPVQLQVGMSEKCIMSSCVKPLLETEKNPVVLLHGFDSSCLEWRYAYPLLEEAGLETWAVDILGWGFSDLERLPSCDVGHVASKRNHLCQFWRSYIKKPMILVGPSLGAAVAIDFAVNHSEAVKQLVLIDASVYTKGTGDQTKLPRIVSYAGVKQETLIIWGEDDQIISSKLAVRLQCELPNAIVRQIPDCGHIPHVEKPDPVAKLIVDFIRGSSC